MKKTDTIATFCYWVMACGLGLHFLGSEAFAAEQTSNWRVWYDLALRYINFGIFVFVFLKYGKTPLLNFLRGEKDKVAREIEKIEDKKRAATDKIKESQQALEDGKVRFVELKERIVDQGEKKKQDIIQDAQNQSAIMIAETQRKVEYQLLRAKRTIREELLDAAIVMALERLPQEITEADNQRFIEQYLASAQTK